MDRRLFLAFGLSMVVLIAWMWLFSPPAPPPQTGKPAGSAEPGPGQGTGLAAPPAATPAAAGTPGAAAGATPGMAPAAIPPSGAPETAVAAPDLPPGAPIQAGKEEEIVVETDLQTIRLSNRGARVLSWRLRRYLDHDEQPLELVSPAARSLGAWPLQVLVDDPAATRALADALHRVERRDETAPDGSKFTAIRFAWSDGKGTAVSRALRVHHGSYVADLEVRALAGGRASVPSIVWGPGFGPHTGLEKGQYAEVVGAVLNAGGETTRRPRTDFKRDVPWDADGRLAWAGLEDKYFAALFVPPSGASGQARFQVRPLVEDGVERFHPEAAFRLAAGGPVRLFVGPKDYQLLHGLNLGLDPLINFGFFGVIALPLFHALKFLHGYVGNYGWSIIILTVVIRVLFFPFMHRGQVKMRHMQEKMKRIQPKVKALKERYRKLERKEADRGNAGARYALRQKMNEEMMAIYKEEAINPLGQMSGCLPLLAQIPILYAFYTILTIAIELRHAPFVLWIDDLSLMDPYYVTPIIMGGTMLVQQWMTSASIPDPAQRKMMYLMPIIFTWMFLRLPSGLVLYWLVNNLLGIGQQYLVNKEADAQMRAQKA
jgi:YidC/Oxa1 family membrane protein insertase